MEGRHLLDIGQLGGEPARRLHDLRGALGPLGLPAGVRAIGVQVLQHAAVGADQPLVHHPLAFTDLLQFGLGLLGVGRHPLAQHLGQVIARAHPGGVHQARHQRQPLEGGVVAHRRRVQGVGLPGEVGDLGRRDPLQPGVGVTDRVHLGHVGGLGLEPRPGRPLCGLLEPVEHRERVLFRHAQQRLEPGLALLPGPFADPGEDLRVDLRADTRGHLVQRGEPRQLQRRLHQAVQRDVDQVGGVVLDPGGLANRLGGDRARPRRIVGHALAGADLLAVPPGGAARPVVGLDIRAQVQAAPHVVDHHVGDLMGPGEARHLLVALQREHDREQRLGGADALARP